MIRCSPTTEIQRAAQSPSKIENERVPHMKCSDIPKKGFYPPLAGGRTVIHSIARAFFLTNRSQLVRSFLYTSGCPRIILGGLLFEFGIWLDPAIP